MSGIPTILESFLETRVTKQFKEDTNMTAREIIENGLYNAAVNMMDDGIREELHRELAPCSDLEFMEAYMRAHEEKFGEEFQI